MRHQSSNLADWLISLLTTHRCVCGADVVCCIHTGVCVRCSHTHPRQPIQNHFPEHSLSRWACQLVHANGGVRHRVLSTTHVTTQWSSPPQTHCGGCWVALALAVGGQMLGATSQHHKRAPLTRLFLPHFDCSTVRIAVSRFANLAVFTPRRHYAGWLTCIGRRISQHVATPDHSG